MLFIFVHFNITLTSLQKVKRITKKERKLFKKNDLFHLVSERKASVFYQNPTYTSPVLLSKNLISSISTLVEIRLKQ